MVKALGQFMTPETLANFVASQVPPSVNVIDLAAGDGSLLRAVSLVRKKARLIGFDIDCKMVEKANSLPKIQVSKKDGLKALIPKSMLDQVTCVIGNPPFLPYPKGARKWLEKAFPSIRGIRGTERAEVHFLARALHIARISGGRVVFIMPIGFADGDIYRNVRSSLTEEYHLVRCVEVIGTPFFDTEARTVVLVIDTKNPNFKKTEIAEYNVGTGNFSVVTSLVLSEGQRLDARFHRAMQRSEIENNILLKDLNVSITRGLVSRKEAEKQKFSALHTSHIGQAAECGMIRARFKDCKEKIENQVIAKKGDILLARTGSRVSWNPILLSEGSAPIT